MTKLISEKLKGITLSGFENIDISAMFRFVSITSAQKKNIKDFVKLILKMLAKFLFDRYKYRINSSSDSVFLFTIPHTTDRKERIDMVYKIAKTSKKDDIIFYEKRLLYPTLILGLRCMYMCFIWHRSLGEARLTVPEKIILFDMLIDAFKFKEKYLTKINIHKYKLLTVLFDAHPFENYLVQIFKHHKVKTATLQHGLILASRSNDDPNVNYELKGTELLCSVSDYFLAWNEFTRQEALKSGMDDKKIKVLGISYFVGHNNAISSVPVKNRLFGVVLNTKQSEGDDIELIKFANALASKINYKYILRYHPTFLGNEYKDIIDHKYYLSNSPKKSSVLDYVKTVEFSLISVSTVYMELIFLNHPTYRFSSGRVEDKYRDINVGGFTDIEGLYNLLNDKNIKEIQNGLFDYLCGTKQVDKNYESFFSSFV